MRQLRVLICDDEPLALRRLAAMLARLPDIELVGTALHGREALELVIGTQPDLVLLDVDMPDVDGFEFVQQLVGLQNRSFAPPLFAFVTAHHHTAAQAYDTSAIDFLSKPFRQSRLEVTLKRAREALDTQDVSRRVHEVERMLDDLRARNDPQRPEHVWITRRAEVLRVDLGAVERISAEGPYVRLHIGATSYMLREPIGSVEHKLDPERFVRIHRSHIVRADTVATIRRTIHGAGELTLLSGMSLPLGRKYAREARRSLLGLPKTATGVGARTDSVNEC